MDEGTIRNELQKYGVTDAAIAKLNADYMALTVTDGNDKKGYEVVKAARIDIKKRRVEVEKTRVTLKAESLEYGRRVDGEAKRITALLEPIETHLIGQEKIVEDMKARIKAEEEAKEAARVQARIDRLESMGMGLIAGHYKLPYGEGLAVPLAILKVCTDDQFAQIVGEIQTKKNAEGARVKAEADRRLEEQALILKVQQEQEVERQRLAKEKADQDAEAQRIKKEQDDAEKKLVIERLAIQAEQMKIEREKQRLVEEEAARAAAIEREKKRIEDEKQRQAELEQARKESAEKALKDAKEKTEREAAAKIEAERKSKEAAERKAARQPDKVKLLAYADQIESVVSPELKTEEGKKILMVFDNELGSILKVLRDEAEAL
jgi:hypothetical protein